MASTGLEHDVAAVGAAPLYFFNQDLALRYTWAPRVPPELAPWLPGSVIGLTDADLIGDESAAPLMELKRAVIRSGVGVREDVAVPTPGGTYHYDLTVEPIMDETDEVIGIAGVAFDITRHREQEAELRRAQARYAEAERIAHIGSWEWDLASDEISWSPGLLHIYGIDADQGARRFPARQRDRRVHPDDRERVDAAVARVLETRLPFDMDYRILRPDGRVRILHARYEVVADSHDLDLIRLVGTAQDVTELRLTESALEEAARELGRRAQELHQFTLGDEPEGLESILGERQFEILNLIAEGLSNVEIGERLFISEATVKWHVRQIFKKLAVANRAQAVARLLSEKGPTQPTSTSA
jgi:PAS domain S-box-containing protein